MTLVLAPIKNVLCKSFITWCVYLDICKTSLISITVTCSSSIATRIKFFSGGTRTKDAYEVLYARQSLVTHAKAFGLDAIDLVDIDYKGT